MRAGDVVGEHLDAIVACNEADERYGLLQEPQQSGRCNTRCYAFATQLQPASGCVRQSSTFLANGNV
jgi:hypothetical protein